MKTCNTEALVLKSNPYSDADRLLTLFTWEKGKVSGIAKGARKTSSKLASGVDLFTHSHFSLYRGKSLYTVTQAQVKEKFSAFHDEPLRYAYAAYFAELVRKLLVEEEPAPEIARLLLYSWRYLDRQGGDDLLARFFELKLLHWEGSSPQLKECVKCLQRGSLKYFSVKAGGMVCQTCGRDGKDVFSISPGTASLIDFLKESSLQNLPRLKASNRQLKELKKINLSFLEYHLEIPPGTSLKFLQSLK